MRLILSFLLAAALGVAAPAQAQTFTVTATGTTINSGTEFGATVPINTPATFTFTFNAATAETIPSTGYGGSSQVETYIDPSGMATVSAGTLRLSVGTPEVRVLSGYQGLYGYEFSGFTGATDTTGGFSIQLLSGSEDVAPTTSLTAVHTIPLSEANVPTIGQLAAVSDTGAQYLDVQLSTFGVAVAVPEPNSFCIGALGFILFGLLKLGAARRRSS